MNDFRKYMNILNENDAPTSIEGKYSRWARLLEAQTTTQTSSQTDDIFARSEKKQNSPAKSNNSSIVGQNQERRVKKGPANITRPSTSTSSLSDYGFNPDALGQDEDDDDWGDMSFDDWDMDEISHDDSTTLPSQEEKGLALKSKELDTTAGSDLASQDAQNVEWTNMMSLPGNAQQLIRTLGRRIFKSFGSVEYDQIDTISTMTNSDSDLNVITNLVGKNGNRIVDQAEMDFGDIMPGYKPTVSVWEHTGNYYMFVEDEHGKYIYTWDKVEGGNKEYNPDFQQQATLPNDNKQIN